MNQAIKLTSISLVIIPALVFAGDDKSLFRFNGYLGIRYLGLVNFGATAEMAKYLYLDYNLSIYDTFYHQIGAGGQYEIGELIFRLGPNLVRGYRPRFDGYNTRHGISLTSDISYIPFEYTGFKIGGAYYFTEESLFPDIPDLTETKTNNELGGSFSVVFRY